MKNHEWQIESAQKELRKEINRAAAFMQAWQNVKRVSKKDGGDFAIISKNFEGCKFCEKGYGLRSVKEKDICVFTSAEGCGYIDDRIDDQEMVRYSKRSIDPSRIIKESYLEAYFVKNADEIQEDINKRAEYWKQVKANLEADLENLPEMLEKVYEMKNDLNQYIGTAKSGTFRRILEKA